MGRFSTTTQIKNNTDRAGFISAFNSVMAKHGFVPCAEDEAAKSYLLAFSEGGWVTFASESDDIPKIVSDMNAISFSVEVVDSDFAIIKLSRNGKETDTVIVGDGSGYGFEEDSPKGEKKYWEPLLADGKTWEQLSEIWNKDEVFVEDALCESAPLLGINSQYMVSDYSELLDEADVDKNIETLYFKEKAADKKSKPMTLNAAFVKVFGEALEPLGFKKIKSRYPYFVRVVPGGEIIHVIALAKYPSHRNSFYVKCGAATVYRGLIDFSKSPHDTDWLDSIHSVVCFLAFNDKIKPIAQLDRLDIIDFEYNENTLINVLETALKWTMKYAVPMLDEVLDIRTFIMSKFFSQLSLQEIYENYGFSLKYLKDMECEGLLWLLFDDREFYNQMCERWTQCELKRIKKCVEGTNFNTTQARYDEYLARLPQILSENLAYYDKVFSDKEWLEKAHEEIKHRKRANIDKLISYGLDVK